MSERFSPAPEEVQSELDALLAKFDEIAGANELEVAGLLKERGLSFDPNELYGDEVSTTELVGELVSSSLSPKTKSGLLAGLMMASTLLSSSSPIINSLNQPKQADAAYTTQVTTDEELGNVLALFGIQNSTAVPQFSPSWLGEPISAAARPEPTIPTEQPITYPSLHISPNKYDGSTNETALEVAQSIDKRLRPGSICGPLIAQLLNDGLGTDFNPYDFQLASVVQMDELLGDAWKRVDYEGVRPADFDPVANHLQVGTVFYLRGYEQPGTGIEGHFMVVTDEDADGYYTYSNVVDRKDGRVTGHLIKRVMLYSKNPGIKGVLQDPVAVKQTLGVNGNEVLGFRLWVPNEATEEKRGSKWDQMDKF